MDFQKFVFAAMLLAPGSIAFAQSADQQIQRSQERIVFFSGTVVLEDGSPPPSPVLIQRVCGGSTRNETWTDAKGAFSFKVQPSENGGAEVDATQAPGQAYDLNKAIGNSTQYSMPISTALRDCELQAVLAGFQSERVSMALKSGTENARVGNLVLHPLSRAGALIVSATTLAAPPNAKKDYEKGLADIKAQKWDAATGAFTKAVKEYPKFAIAWYQLGLAREKSNDAAGAVEAWKEAVKSDPKYVKPYENLTLLADQKGDWAEAERESRAWIELDPEEFPAAHLFNAVANARLNRMDEAELAARQGLRVDKDHRVPRLSYVLGLILLDKGKLGESAECFRTYLQLAPNAKDAAAVREQLSKLGEAAAAAPPR